MFMFTYNHDGEYNTNHVTSSAKHIPSDQLVAVKKVLKPFQTAMHAKRTYRELALLKHMRHENVRGKVNMGQYGVKGKGRKE